MGTRYKRLIDKIAASQFNNMFSILDSMTQIAYHYYILKSIRSIACWRIHKMK